MLKASVVGPKVLYLNPSADTFSSAEIALIDTVYDTSTVQPYAYTATVRDDYDSFNFHMGTSGSAVVASTRVAFGLFLSPENSKGNLLFQVSGRAAYYFSTASSFRTGFFFGRKATNNTVVSSKASANNTLANWEMLPCDSSVVASSYIDQGIEKEVFSLQSSTGYVYCFGYMIENLHAATSITAYGGVNLQIRKFTSVAGASVLDVYNPAGF